MAMYFKRILENLEFAVIIVPLIIAGTQIYFSKMDTLSAWRGGGFGMYTEPHPVNYRTAFLINENDPQGSWIRIYPPDNRLDSLRQEVEGYIQQIGKISGTVRARITFPSRINNKVLTNELTNLKSKWQGMDVPYMPSDTIKLQVLETGIASDFKSISQKVIYESQICLTR